MTEAPTTQRTIQPALVTELLADLLTERTGAAEVPALSYLRRKPGRGFVAVYGTTRDPDHIYTVAIDDRAPTTGTVDRADVPTSGWHGSWPGLVTDAERGVAVQTFPRDRLLPALATVMRPDEDDELRAAIELAGRRALSNGAEGELDRIRAVPLRYKPGDRCVIRYELDFGGTASPRPRTRTSVVGKVYRDPADAAGAADVLDRLQRSGMGAWSARPLAVVERLGLVITEDLAQRNPAARTAPGSDVIHIHSPEAADAIAAAATALAVLHSGDAAAADTRLRHGADEAAKAERRGEVLSRHAPGLAACISRTAAEVAGRLRLLEPTRYRPGHGSFKPSQLLVSGPATFVIDFDQFCRADPALDVGYFLAYLRPAGLFYRRPQVREWFDRAAAAFRDGYGAAAQDRGVQADEVAGILDRSASYEAALLLKIAARRANRMQSPRPGEIRAILDEIGSCLAVR